MHRRQHLYLAAAVLAALAFTPQPQEAPPLIGFSPQAAAEQHALEARFDEQVAPGRLRDRMEHMTQRPFWTGSPYNREMALYQAEQFREWGFDVEIEEFQVLYPTPRIRQLELLSPTQYTAQLREPPIEGDAASQIQEDRLPTYNAYSADGDVTAELVYVNYGIPADYDELARREASTSRARS